MVSGVKVMGMSRLQWVMPSSYLLTNTITTLQSTNMHSLSPRLDIGMLHIGKFQTRLFRPALIASC